MLAAFFSGGSTLASMHAAINRDVAAQQTTAQNQMTFNKDKLAATYNTYLMGSAERPRRHPGQGRGDGYGLLQRREPREPSPCRVAARP